MTEKNKTFVTLSKNIPIQAYADVVITGDGPSGFIAAGAAAAISLAENVCFQDLNIRYLQKLLQKQNAII